VQSLALLVGIEKFMSECGVDERGGKEWDAGGERWQGELTWRRCGG